MSKKHNIISVDELLKKQLSIPNYQRPYKWTVNNIDALLCDVMHAVSDQQRFGDSFRYRIGTVIVHSPETDVYEIVDGQQRIISLLAGQRGDFKALAGDFVRRVLHKDIPEHEAAPGGFGTVAEMR